HNPILTAGPVPLVALGSSPGPRPAHQAAAPPTQGGGLFACPASPRAFSYSVVRFFDPPAIPSSGIATPGSITMKRTTWVAASLTALLALACIHLPWPSGAGQSAGAQGGRGAASTANGSMRDCMRELGSTRS